MVVVVVGVVIVVVVVNVVVIYNPNWHSNQDEENQFRILR